MKFGGIVAPNSGCLKLTLGPCSSFSFGVVSVLHFTHSLTHSLTKCFDGISLCAVVWSLEVGSSNGSSKFH